MKTGIFLILILSMSIASALVYGNTVESYSRALRLVSIPAGIAVLAFLSLRKTNEKEKKNILDNSIVNKFVISRLYKPLLQIPTLIIFLVVLYFAFFGTAFASLNLSTVLTWTVWWAAIIFTFILVGRIWCTACPFAYLGDKFQKVFSLNKKFPYKLRNLGIQITLFLVLTWSFVIFGIASSPFLTGFLILSLIGGAIIFSIVYEKRTFCKYVCPIGALIGLYSLTSPVELRSKDKDVCAKHLDKSCLKSCSMMEYMGNMDTNFNCNLCMECVKACPKNNIRLSFRGFGSDLLHNKKIGIITAIAASALLGVSLFQTLAMMGIWETVLSAAASMLGIFDFPVVFTILFITLGIALPLGGFSLFAYFSKLLSGHSFRSVFANFGLLLIPQGVAIHLAHNFNHLLVEGAEVRNVLQFSLNPGNVNWGGGPILASSEVFWMQAAVVILGFFLSLIVGVGISKNKFQSVKPFIPVFVLLVLINLVSLYIIGLPMNPRHVH